MGSVIRIKTLAELKQLFDELMERNAIFRGVNNKSQLYPKIIRDNDYSKKEYQILKTFEKYYGLYSTANNCWEFLALAQHCGLMTRLIDFTSNPYVALFFCLRNAKGKDGEYIIYALDKTNTNVIYESIKSEPFFNSKTATLTLDDMAFQIDVPYCDILNREFKKLSKKTGIYTVKPNYRNQRMLVQQGLFVVPSKLTKESVENRIAKKSQIIIIDDAIRAKALLYLEKLGYDEFHLMPDLDNICNEINHRIICGLK